MKDFKPFLKKLLQFYIIAVSLVLIYFVLRTLFSEEKTIELKHFKTAKEINTTQVNYENNSLDDKNDTQRILLLPKGQ